MATYAESGHEPDLVTRRFFRPSAKPAFDERLAGIEVRHSGDATHGVDRILFHHIIVIAAHVEAAGGQDDDLGADVAVAECLEVLCGRPIYRSECHCCDD